MAPSPNRISAHGRARRAVFPLRFPLSTPIRCQGTTWVDEETHSLIDYDEAPCRLIRVVSFFSYPPTRTHTLTYPLASVYGLLN